MNILCVVSKLVREKTHCTERLRGKKAAERCGNVAKITNVYNVKRYTINII